MQDRILKVLAVDDNNDNLITIKALINDSFPNVQVLTALNGEKGIELAMSEIPDVILLDVIMPFMDGFEVCKLLKNNKVLADIPVVFVTAFKADKESRIKALETGAEGFLAKPIDESELVSQIRAMLRIRLANMEKQTENERLAALVAERTKELRLTHSATLNLLDDLRKENEARRLTTEALSESQARLTRAEFTSKSGNWELHLDTMMMIASEGAIKLYGLSGAENIYATLTSVPLPAYRAALDVALKNLIEKNETYSIDFKIEQINTGDIIDIHSNAFFDKERRIVFGVIRDVTEQKLIQKALLESEALYRSVINASPDNITVADLDGKIKMISPKGCQLLDYEDDELFVGRNLNEFIAQKDRQRAHENILGMFSGVFNGPEEYELVKADGSTIDTEINAEFVLDVNDDPAGLVFSIRDVTERKRAQNTIRESERKYRFITEKITDVVWIMDLSGKSLFVSQSVEKFSGYTVDEYLAQSISDRFTPESAVRAIKDLSDEVEWYNSGEISFKDYKRIFELDYRCKDGSVKTGEILITPYFNEDEVLTGFHGVTRDITMRKKALDALSGSEEKYRLLVENSPNGIAIHQDGKFVYINKAGLKVFGVEKPADFIGKSVFSVVHPEDLEIVRERIGLVEAGNPVPIIEVKLIKFDGTIFDAEVVALATTYNGRPAGQVIIRDISERKIIAEQLRESEALYRAILDASPDMITITDLDGRIIKVSPSSLMKYQIENDDEVIGRVLTDFIAPEDRERISNDFNLRIRGVKTGPHEYKAMLANGNTFDVEINGGLIMNSEGEVEKFVAIARDVTDRKHAEISLEQSRTELRAIYDNAPVMMCVVDRDRHILFANNAFASLTNILDEMMGGVTVGGVIRCISSFDNPKGCGYGEKCSSCKLHIAIDDTYRTGKSYQNIEYQSTLLVGTKQVEVSLLGSTALIETGNVRNVLLCLHDITDRKNAEEALQKSEMLLRTFIDNSPFEIWARDNDSVGILENKKMTDHFGTIIGLTPTTDPRINEETRQLWRRNNDRVFAGEIIDEEYLFVVNGESRMFQQIVFPIEINRKIIGIAGFNIDITDRKFAEEALRESREQLKKFAAHLQNVREEERVLLAREIHDQLGQILVAVKIDIGMLKLNVLKHVDANSYEKLLGKFDDLSSLVDTTIKTARKIMTDLRPEILDMLGFIDTVKQHLIGFHERYKLPYNFTTQINKLELTTQQSVALFRIVQEATNNIAKHAKATHLDVSITCADDKLVLVIVDNGVGFDPHHKNNLGSYGLLGMKERVFLLDGELNIFSKKNKGTTIQVRIPYLQQ